MNIREIAKKAGVSVATVSRVLNHPDTVARATKEKIQAIMEEEEYTPNWFAQSLNFNKTKTIGLMIPHILNPSQMEIVKGIEDVAHQKDYTAFLCNVDNDVNKEKKYLSNLIQRRVDGIVLISSHLEKEDINAIIEQKIPVVLVGENRGNTGVSVVRVDCKQATLVAMKHLIDIGYKDIGILYGTTPEIENSRKIEGYREAMLQSGLNINEEYIIKAENTIEGGYVGAKKFILHKNTPRAIFATSDLIAFGVIDALKDNNKRVPEDVAVMGFDNIKMSNLIEPRLTTVEKPLHKLGVVGARLLFDIIEGKDEPREILLQSKLKIRKSCGHTDRIEEMF